MILNRSFKDFKFQHKKKENQIIYTSRKIHDDREILNLINNFLKEKNSFIFESVEKGKIRGRYTIFGKNMIRKIKLNSINDNKKFETNSIIILYSLPINSFTLVADKQNNVFIARTVSYKEENIKKSSVNFNKISIEEGAQSKNDILKSYDLFLNNRYQVVVNEKTLERVKNYFK